MRICRSMISKSAMEGWHLSKNFPITSRRGFARLMTSLAAGIGAASNLAMARNKTKPGSSGSVPETQKSKGGGMKPLMHRDKMEPYDLRDIAYIQGVDHNESLSVGPKGEAYTCGFN